MQWREHRHRARRAGNSFTGFGSQLAHSSPRCEEQRPRDFPGYADESGDVGVNEIGSDSVGCEVGMRQHRLDERNVGGDTADAKLTQGARRFLHEIGPACSRRMNDDLG